MRNCFQLVNGTKKEVEELIEAGGEVNERHVQVCYYYNMYYIFITTMFIGDNVNL